MKEFGIDSTGHQETGPACGCLKQFYQLLVGRHECSRNFVKARSEPEAEFANPCTDLELPRWRQEEQKRQRPALRVLMDVGVPGSDEGDAQTVSEERTEDSDIAGTSYVQNVGRELPQQLADSQKWRRKARSKSC